MAKSKLVFINKRQNIVHFTLSNRPSYLCKMDADKYYELMEKSNSYFIKEGKRSGVINSVYIVRAGRKKDKLPREKKCHTYYLHWDILGYRTDIKSGTYTDHENLNKLDNRSENIRALTFQDSSRNRKFSHESLARRSGLPAGYSMSKNIKNNKPHYQAYLYRAKERIFIKSSICIDVVKTAVMRHKKESE